MTTHACPICAAETLRLRYTFPWGQVMECCTCSGASAQFVSDAALLDRQSSEFGAYSTRDDYAHVSAMMFARQRLATVRRYSQTGRVIDFGCGTGEFLKVAFEAGFEVEGVDLYSRILPENQVPGLTVWTQGLEQFEAAVPADVAVAFHCLEHVAQPMGAVQKMLACLKPGGILVLEVPNYQSWSRRLQGAGWGCFVPYHSLHFTPKSLSRLLQQAGATVERIASVENPLPIDQLYWAPRMRIWAGLKRWHPGLAPRPSAGVVSGDLGHPTWKKVFYQWEWLGVYWATRPYNYVVEMIANRWLAGSYLRVVARKSKAVL